MNNFTLRRTFVLFHCTLAVVIFFLSLNTIIQSATAHKFGPMILHIVLLAVVEALAAVLFLLPWTIKVGVSVLLLIFAVAVSVHGVQEELSLFVYAAGVVFVMVHGSAFSKDLFRLRKGAA